MELVVQSGRVYRIYQNPSDDTPFLHLLKNRLYPLEVDFVNPIYQDQEINPTLPHGVQLVEYHNGLCKLSEIIFNGLVMQEICSFYYASI